MVIDLRLSVGRLGIKPSSGSLLLALCRFVSSDWLTANVTHSHHFTRCGIITGNLDDRKCDTLTPLHPLWNNNREFGCTLCFQTGLS
jgi:hypothetical protein